MALEEKPISKRGSRVAAMILAAKIGLGSATTPNQQSLGNEQATANQLTREKAYSRGRGLQNNADVIPFSSPANTGLQTDSTDEDENSDFNSEPEDQNLIVAQAQQAARQQQIASAQTQITLQQQQQAATTMSAQKQSQLRSLQQDDQQIDKESAQITKDLKKFQNSKTNRYLSIFRPNIGFIIEKLLDSLKRQTGNFTYRKKIMFLKMALIRLNLFLAALKSFRFISSFLDAFFSWIRWMTLTLGTIIIPIVLFILGFFIVPFTSLAFYIGKIPLLQGKMTRDVINMIEQSRQQQNLWLNELQKLRQLVSRQDRKKANQTKEEQIQKQA